MRRIFKVVASILMVAVLFTSIDVNAATKKYKTSVTTTKTTETSVSPYQIRVNRVANCVTVYQIDANGEYTNPIRSFACSVGKNIEDTPLGTYKTSDYYEWRLMVDGSYAQYAIRFNKGILFHSVPYLSDSPDTLEADQFNLLGQNASLGCVRLATSDVKWLYENCPQGTEVIVYDDATNPGPLGKPEQMKTIIGFTFSGWDPTDDRAENPWNAYKPTLYLRNDFGNNVLYMFVGESEADLQKYIGCKNFQGTDLTEENYKVTINGNYNFQVSGVYTVWISVFDALGIKTEQKMTLAVLPVTQ